jgi:CheY-like chemotaxis protein
VTGDDVAAPPIAEGVLVVEDDADILHALVQVLEDEGHSVRTAVNGRAALDLLRAPGTHPPRVILLDLMMPVMDGWTFRAEQLRDPTLAQIPVVLLTADTGAEEKTAQLKIAVSLRKPVELPRLLATVEAYLM